MICQANFNQKGNKYDLYKEKINYRQEVYRSIFILLLVLQINWEFIVKFLDIHLLPSPLIKQKDNGKQLQGQPF